jgi:linoleoyl-CoA desaturase
MAGKMNYKKVRLSQEQNSAFILALRNKVNTYFEEHGISRYANGNMVFKTVFMISLYLVPYSLMISGMFSGFLMLAMLWVLMGLGMAGIGLSVMHDANHMAYSKNPRLNRILGYLLNLIGGHALNWQIQHNLLHHGFTNVDGLDEDIDPGKMLRFSPHRKRYRIHRWQHIYAWFLYGLMTLSWVTYSDFIQLYRYYRQGFFSGKKKTLFLLLLELIVSKIFYISYILIIPIIFLPVSWWMVLVLFIIAHFICGLTLAIIFQSAHVVTGSQFPLPDGNGKIDNNWAVHQLMTTADFSPGSRIFSWLIGGLNYQVEHHLFPNICHVHYRRIAQTVRDTALESDLPYRVQPSFASAILNHARMLRMLGRENDAGQSPQTTT